MKKQILDNVGGIVAILVIAILASVVGVYILLQQRIKPPFSDRYEITAVFSAAAGLTPGAGQPVNVAGVKVGQVGDVKLQDGRAVVTLEMNPKKLPKVFADAHARLVPRTPLKDLQLELSPGTRGGRPLGGNGTSGQIPVAQTSDPIDSDELLRALDTDTRQYMRVLLADSARGLDDRGPDLRKVLRQLQPTAEQVASLTGSLKQRRLALRGVVSELNTLAGAAGDRDTELQQLLVTGNQTLSTLASEEGNLRSSVRQLPATLAATRKSLEPVKTFTAELAPALQRLRPSLRRLPGALRSLDPLTAVTPQIVRKQIRPLAREARPLVRELRPAARNLTAATPSLTTSVKELTYVVNELAYNPAGDDEGYLYWLAWFSHNAASFLSTQDANGPAWRGMLLLSCDSLAALPGDAGVLLGGVLGTLPICPGGGS